MVEKKGVCKIGFIRSFPLFMNKLKELLEENNMSQEEFDSDIERQLDDPKTYVDDDLHCVSRESATKRKFETQLLSLDNAMPIFVVFEKNARDYPIWVGAELATEEGPVLVEARGFELLSGGTMEDFESAARKLVENAPYLLAELKHALEPLGFKWAGKIKSAISSLESVAVVEDAHPHPVAYIALRDRAGDTAYLSRGEGFITGGEPGVIPTTHPIVKADGGVVSSGGDSATLEKALFELVKDAPYLLAQVKRALEPRGYTLSGRVRTAVNAMPSLTVVFDAHPDPVAYLARRDMATSAEYLSRGSGFIVGDTSSAAVRVEDREKESRATTKTSTGQHDAGRVRTGTRNGFIGLYRRSKAQSFNDVFAFFPKEGDDWDAAFHKLAEMAMQGERWENPSFPKGNVEILKNYLNYTFLRLQDEGKILYAQNGDWACFNTGLQTREHGKDIIATFRRSATAACSSGDGMAPWTFYTFWDVDRADFRGFPHNHPEVAEYYTKVSDLFFDLDYDLTWNAEHIVEENEDRLPESMRGNVHQASLTIEGALKRLKGRIRRNYKLAIPHWYHGRVQLLLPLCLTNDNAADLALVADKDEVHKCYRIQTILTPVMAYTDARVICRPDGEWLRIPMPDQTV